MGYGKLRSGRSSSRAAEARSQQAAAAQQQAVAAVGGQHAIDLRRDGRRGNLCQIPDVGSHRLLSALDKCEQDTNS